MRRMTVKNVSTESSARLMHSPIVKNCYQLCRRNEYRIASTDIRVYLNDLLTIQSDGIFGNYNKLENL
jgi:hypothetical protein